MSFIEQLLQGLKAAEGDTRAQAAVAAGFVLQARPEPEREPLREAFDAAAVLRWFDAPLLAGLLDISQDDARCRFEALKSLPFVEPFRLRERDLRNVHESTRLGWRNQLAQADGPRFRLLSKRASECFAGDESPGGQIECVYHLLCGEPERGADRLAELTQQWSSSAHLEDEYALATSMKELEDSRIVGGRARAWALLAIGWARSERGEIAQLEQEAKVISGLAEDTRDRRAQADAAALLGDVLEAQGKLAEAQAAYGECLAISRRLAGQDPSNAGWQRDLAVTLGDIARIRAAKGEVDAALQLQQERLAVNEKLEDMDGIAAASWDIAQLELRRRDFKAAFPPLARSYSILQQIGRLDGLCTVGMLFGQFLCAAGKREEGIKVLTRSRDGFLKLGRSQDAKQTQALLDGLSQ